MLPRPKVILFDLDDTLISFDGVSSQAWRESCINLIERFSLSIDSDTLIKYIQDAREGYWSNPERHKFGRSNLLSARRKIAALAMEKLNIYNEAISNELADLYSVKREKMIHLFPNTISTLIKLKQKEIRLGMITNGTCESQRRKIKRFDLAKYFDQILIEGEVGCGKPDFRIYKSALSYFNVFPEETWMVGDNLVWDIGLPQSLGMYGIWHDYRKLGLPNSNKIMPNKIIKDISQLLIFLKKTN